MSTIKQKDESNELALSPAPDNDTKFLALQDEADEAEYAKKTKTQKIITALIYVVLAMAAMYVFMVAVKLIGEGFTLALGCDTKGAFDFANNPVAGLMVGTIATALLHSSSTVTSITVALVGSGGMTIRQGVYVVMGANIGTCITCIMVAFAQVGDRARFQRAMAAATVHDMYNIWSVIVMFPLEVLFQPLERISRAMSKSKVSGGDFKSPVDVVVNPLVQKIIVVDKKTIYKIATGEKTCEAGKSFVTAGAFEGSSMSDATIGALVVVIGFCFLVVALVTLVKMLAKVFLGPTKRIISKILNYNGYVNIIVGTGITFAVHSSTIVTSTLTPMAGLGVITLEQVYPIVIGANLGTTGTALIASMVTGKSDAVAIALVHFWFNVFGIFMFYPIPITRKPIYSWARALAYFSACWAMSAVIFLVLLFLVLPGVLLVLVYMCTASSSGTQVAGYLLSAICGIVFLGSLFWYHKKGGSEMWHSFLERKRDERDAKEGLVKEYKNSISHSHVGEEAA